MNCRYCGTELPNGALFCGECGRAVNVDEGRVSATASARRGESQFGVEAARPDAVAVAVAGFSIADLAFSSPGETSPPDEVDDRALPDGAPGDGDGDGVGEGADDGSSARCPQCGEPMADGDVFCGECGFVLRTVFPPAGEEPTPTSIIVIPDLIRLASPSGADADADVTTEVEPLSASTEHDASEGEDPDNGPDAGEPDDGAPEAGEPHRGEPSAEDEPAIDDLVRERAGADSLPAADPDLEFEFDEPLPFSLPIARPSLVTRSRPIPDPFPWGTDQPLREDIEKTRLVADTGSGNRFILQFSTGESVTVLGSGLVGRNPSLQPGEYVDQLVPIFDAGKSVSKTHLEFGQEAGRFWVSDRYSTNGSVIRQPDAEPRRCDPGRRYFIARGTRIDIGEQFFVVS